MITATERRLGEIFTEYTGVGQLTRDDDVYELGADSLLVVRMALHIEREFGVELPTEVFESEGTIAAVGAWIDEAIARRNRLG